MQLNGKKGCRGFGIFSFFQAGPPDLDTMWELFSIIFVLEPEFCFGGIFEAILHMAKSMILLMALKSGYHQLRLVVYPIIYMVFKNNIPGGEIAPLFGCSQRKSCSQWGPPPTSTVTEVQNRNTDLRTFRGPGCSAVGFRNKQTWGCHSSNRYVIVEPRRGNKSW